MLFRLALALGKTIAELRATLSFREFQEWCTYYELEPWGEQRADLRSGIVAAELENVYARIMGHKPEAKPSSFMPYIEKASPPDTEPVEQRELTDDELAVFADAAIFGIAPEGKEGNDGKSNF